MDGRVPARPATDASGGTPSFVRRARAVTLAIAVLYVCTPASASQWAVDPTEPGPRVPVLGTSLFDELTADGVPFPFEALLAHIDRRLGCAPRGCMEAVLIPLGRSLQRMSASPDFFASPRVVVAVTRNGDGRLLGRDRLFLGYQPRAAVLEVISYNDRAGRFEFQVVHDYRAGARPRTTMAERTVCVACHQNHAPIFSRPLWSETSANPAVVAELRAGAGIPSNGRWQGVDLSRGVDAPNAIDDATDAANLNAVTQRIWRDACDPKCRGAAVRAAATYRLSNGRVFEPLPMLAGAFAAAFPDGLAIPNSDLPNRDPFASGATGAMRANVDGQFEALRPRAPLDTWHASDPNLARRFVLGLASMLTEADVARIGRRTSEGSVPASVGAIEGAVASRAVLRGALGLPSIDTGAARPVVSSSAVTAVVDDAAKSAPALPAAEATFVAPCGACHATDTHTPPNFLGGDAARVASSLRQCAPRIFVRLAMWQRDPQQWAKVPMPPPRAAEDGHPAMQVAADPAVANLRRTVTEWLTEEGHREPSLDGLLAQGYENLRPCLPAGM